MQSLLSSEVETTQSLLSSGVETLSNFGNTQSLLSSEVETWNNFRKHNYYHLAWKLETIFEKTQSLLSSWVKLKIILETTHLITLARRRVLR